MVTTVLYSRQRKINVCVTELPTAYVELYAGL